MTPEEFKSTEERYVKAREIQARIEDCNAAVKILDDSPVVILDGRYSRLKGGDNEPFTNHNSRALPYEMIDAIRKGACQALDELRHAAEKAMEEL